MVSRNVEIRFRANNLCSSPITTGLPVITRDALHTPHIAIENIPFGRCLNVIKIGSILIFDATAFVEKALDTLGLIKPTESQDWKAIFRKTDWVTLLLDTPLSQFFNQALGCDVIVVIVTSSGMSTALIQFALVQGVGLFSSTMIDRSLRAGVKQWHRIDCDPDWAGFCERC